MNTPNVADVVARLHELVHAITQGRESLLREFTMRVPAEPKRDADLVLSTAASLLESEHKARVEAERKLNLANGTIANLMDNGCPYCLTSHEGTSYCTLAENAIEAETRKREQAERELATLRNRPCPYVHSSGEGTHYCTLPHVAERELAEMRERLEKAPRVTFRLGYAEGLFEVDSAQEDHLVPTGQRVAIVPLGECE